MEKKGREVISDHLAKSNTPYCRYATDPVLQKIWRLKINSNPSQNLLEYSDTGIQQMLDIPKFVYLKEFINLLLAGEKRAALYVGWSQARYGTGARSKILN